MRGKSGGMIPFTSKSLRAMADVLEGKGGRRDRILWRSQEGSGGTERAPFSWNSGGLAWVRGDRETS